MLTDEHPTRTPHRSIMLFSGVLVAVGLSLLPSSADAGKKPKVRAGASATANAQRGPAVVGANANANANASVQRNPGGPRVLRPPVPRRLSPLPPAVCRIVRSPIIPLLGGRRLCASP